MVCVAVLARRGGLSGVVTGVEPEEGAGGEKEDDEQSTAASVDACGGGSCVGESGGEDGRGIGRMEKARHEFGLVVVVVVARKKGNFR